LLARKIAVAKKEAAEKFLSKFTILIFVKKSSDFNQKAPPIFYFKGFERKELQEFSIRASGEVGRIKQCAIC
jgi:hypothetical protein